MEAVAQCSGLHWSWGGGCCMHPGFVTYSQKDHCSRCTHAAFASSAVDEVQTLLGEVPDAFMSTHLHAKVCRFGGLIGPPQSSGTESPATLHVLVAAQCLRSTKVTLSRLLMAEIGGQKEDSASSSI